MNATKAIHNLMERIETVTTSHEAMQYAQALLNLVLALQVDKDEVAKIAAPGEGKP